MAPESILCITWVCLWLMLDSNLVNIMDFTLSRLIYFSLTILKLLFCSSGSTMHDSPSWLILWTVLLPDQPCCCQHVDLQTVLKWFCLPHPLHYMPYARHCFGGFCVPQYLHFLHFFLHSRGNMIILLYAMCYWVVELCRMFMASQVILTCKCQVTPKTISQVILTCYC